MHRLFATLWLLSAAIGTANGQEEYDLFCMAGQSNMVGWSTGGQSITGDNTLFEDVMNITNNHGADRQMLIDVIKTAQLCCAGDATTAGQLAELEADGVIDLHNRGILADLMNPMTDATCFKGAGSGVGVSPYDAGCGAAFGPELTFSHVMQKEKGYGTSTRPLETRKAVRGGQPILEFLPGGGWDFLLPDAIQGSGVPPNGAYKGFAWYQGENDVYNNPETPYLDYYSRLTQVVEWSLDMMFQHGTTSSHFECKEQIPVVVVEIGYHPQCCASLEEYEAVKQAQADFIQDLQAAGRPAAFISGIDQYSRHYHLDAPTYMLLGSWIADAFAQLLSVAPDPAICDVCSNCGALSKEACEVECPTQCYYQYGSASVRGCKPVDGGGGGGGGSGGDPPTDCSVCGNLSRQECQNDCQNECNLVKSNGWVCEPKAGTAATLEEQESVNIFQGHNSLRSETPTSAPTSLWDGSSP